jgi:hypothetical protein
MKRREDARTATGARALAALVACAIAGASGAGRADSCDAGLALADTDAMHGAAAIGLCTLSVASSEGLVTAAYGTADFSSLLGSHMLGLDGVGLLAAFGPNVAPRNGDRMLALSSGAARSPSDDGYQSVTGYSKAFSSSAPPGFPAVVEPECSAPSGNVYDSAALRVTLIPPDWANSYHFDFKFHSIDYPNFLCTAYNDQFVVLASPAPVGALAGDVAFDAQANPITVNSQQFVTVCSGGSYACASGAAELQGTGFEGGAATQWLRTTAPVTPGDPITLTFAIWDSGDPTLDATVLLDAFSWSGATVAGPSTVVAPEPNVPSIATSAIAVLVWAERRKRARTARHSQPKEIGTP